MSESVWEILEEQDIVPRPKLPTVEKIVDKAREKRCSVQLNYPSDPDDSVLAVVTRAGQTFRASEDKGVEALAVALAECLTKTEPVQLRLDDTESGAVVEPAIFDQVNDHLASVEESDSSDTPPPQEDDAPTSDESTEEGEPKRGRTR